MIHLQIAEAGRAQSRRGRHDAALERYREALRRAVRERAAPVFLHHYTECILDALEAGGHAAQALELTERALADRAMRATRAGSERRSARASPSGASCSFSPAGARHARTRRWRSIPTARGPVLDALRAARRRRLAVTPDWLAGLRRRMTARTELRIDDAAAGEAAFEKETCDG